MLNLVRYILISLIHLEGHTIKLRPLSDEVMEDYEIMNMNFASLQGKCNS